jgi:diaminopimelate epimerase
MNVSSLMQATLYSGTGNLLWVVEIPPGTDVFADNRWADLARMLCEEEGDGLMLVTHTAPYHANFFNPDGSDGVFCGNGVRCVAFHLVQQQAASPLNIIMAGQEIQCEVMSEQVRIKLPKTGVQSLGLTTLEVFHDLTLSGFRMNMPNPHWVVFAEITEDKLERVGAKVAELYQDAGSMNVEFVFKNSRNEWQAFVYERGAGITEACGSGAMAVLCVLQNEGLIPGGRPLALRMSGGLLTLQDLGPHLSLMGEVQLIKERMIHAPQS